MVVSCGIFVEGYIDPPTIIDLVTIHSKMGNLFGHVKHECHFDFLLPDDVIGQNTTCIALLDRMKIRNTHLQIYVYVLLLYV